VSGEFITVSGEGKGEFWILVVNTTQVAQLTHFKKVSRLVLDIGDQCVA
jgi:hypothetical protein